MSINSSNHKTAFVSIESGITALGFRRIAAVARSINPLLDIYFIPVDNLYSALSHLFPSKKINFVERDAEIAGRLLSSYALVCFSFMSASARYAEMIVNYIRKYNKDVFIIFGGVHTIIYPEDMLNFADGICIGEGEKCFDLFYRAYISGKDFVNTPGMWFNQEGKIFKNDKIQLNCNVDLNTFPWLYNGFDCNIYDISKQAFRNFTKFDYIDFNGLSYRTVWTRGCPFSCSFCANDFFIKLDKGCSKIRYPDPEYIVNEIQKALVIYPYILSVVFYDDNLIALPSKILIKFSDLYKKRIGLPFVVFGTHPNLVNQEKINILADAGMNRVRMGIQSGNEKTLNFYNRRTPKKRIYTSAKILSESAKIHNMIPPAYDIITDNPLEERQDIIETLRFVYELERPFTLTIFGLRLFPYTKLWDYFEKICDMLPNNYNNTSYLTTRPSLGNILLYCLAIVRPPTKLFEFCLHFVKGHNECQKEYPVLHLLVRTIYLMKRAFDHIIRLDFTTITGCWLYFFWKIKLIRPKPKVKERH